MSSAALPALLRAALAALALATALSCALGSQQRADSASAEARKTPEFGECTNGKALESKSNCAEVCAAKGKACQQSGCPHPDNKDNRFGGLSYGGSLCLEKPLKGFQCYDPFDNEVGVRCCCVAQ